MKTVNIGGKIPASAIALGCMRMGHLDEKRVDAIIDTALEKGINFFDHADIYGGGNSERVFGGYLARHAGAREKMLIQTKCAIHDGQYDFSKEHILKSVDGSLSRLGVDYIDVLLLHRPDTLMEPEEVAEAFEAYHKGMNTLGEELADVCLYILGLCEIKGISLEKEILNKLEIIKKRKYVKINGAMVKQSKDDK